MSIKHLYELLQSDSNILWGMIREQDTRRGKTVYFLILSLRAFLVVAFSVLIVELVTRLFGDVFVPLGVALLVMILTHYVVPHGYRITDSFWTLAVVLGILIFIPTLTLYVPGWTLIFIHLISLTVLFSMTCQNPQLGLGGMYGLVYAYLMRDPVEISMLPQEIGMFVLCYIVLVLILFHKHRKKDVDVKYVDYLRNFNIHNPRCIWLIRITLGLSVILAVGMAFHIPRFTWVSFAASTVLGLYPFGRDTRKRLLDRVVGIAIGCVGFYILAQFVPQENYNLIGLISGFILGYFYEYRVKTIIICFAPLAIAAPLYGIEGASFLRIMNNVIGALFATLLVILFDRFVVKKLVTEPEQEPEIVPDR